jgi:hypothetical protein
MGCVKHGLTQPARPDWRPYPHPLNVRGNAEVITVAGLLKSLIGKSRQKPAAEDIEALERANRVLQFRVAQMTKAAPPETGKEAA